MVIVFLLYSEKNYNCSIHRYFMSKTKNYYSLQCFKISQQTKWDAKGEGTYEKRGYLL